jgi:hypothetical protein
MPDPTPNPKPADVASPPKGESFYDASFTIEAIQHEPYENGFTWRTVLGALFVAFVMLPGVIFMGLMIGQDLGTAAEWVTIILFVELARRAFVQMKKQELYILKYTLSHLTHVAGGLALGGGMFAHLVYNRYLRNSEEFYNFGIAGQVPDWFSPMGDAAYQAFWHRVWWPVIGVTVGAMLLSKLTQLSLGFLVYKLTADVEKLPFPLAPIHAEGAIALAEVSQEQHKKGFRQYCFAVGAMMGAAFSLVYMAVPTLTQAFLGKGIFLLPVPFLDLTEFTRHTFPACAIGLTFNIGVLFAGFVLPWRVVIGGFISTILFQLVLNPFVLYPLGLLPRWTPSKDLIQTQVSNSIDFYMSVGIGTAFAVCFVGVWGIVQAVRKYRQDASAGKSSTDFSKLWQRDKERGDPPTWTAVAVWLGSAAGFVWLSDHLINGGVPQAEQFSIWWLVAFAFVWTPINSYINARMSGIAGAHTGVPFIYESAVLLSGYKRVNIWFAPLPLANFGGMADLLRETQLTRTKFTSLLKVELLIFPLMMVASFIFWSYITGLGPIPSDAYPYTQKFWPMHAQMKALWASSMQEGQSLLLTALKPLVILGALGVTLALFIGFGVAGISAQYIYGAIGAVNGLPHTAILVFIGACLGRYVLARKFGKEKWQSFAPILAVGFGAGMGLVGMLAIAINFLWTSIGTRY